MATIERYQTACGTMFYAVRYRTPDRRTDVRSAGSEQRKPRKRWAQRCRSQQADGRIRRAGAGEGHGRRTGARLAGPQASDTPRRRTTACWNQPTACTWQPPWGNVAVADIDVLGVESWIAGMSRKGAGATTVLRAYGVLAGILADAVKEQTLAVNPAKGVENLPRKTAQAARVSERRRRTPAGRRRSGEHRALVLVLAYCGIRWGEAIALRVRDVEFLRQRLIGVGERRAARRAARCGADEGPQSALGAGADVRARRTVSAVQRQGAG